MRFLQKRNVALTAKADTVAQKRLEVAYNRYVIGKIAVDILYTAQTEKISKPERRFANGGNRELGTG